ncbi:MAG: hypothetical protein HOW97_14760, partial [Catenulispora sp.]|nr:hypothetical protein [Catenulispora sp.]
MSAEESTAATAEALLDAGAVVPWTGGPDDRPGDREDVLQARAYRHPALEGRTVVRLVPRALGEAEDLTMEFLGFGRPTSAAGAAASAGAGLSEAGEAGPTDAAAASAAGDIADVGVVLRKSLGFPAWALVNDPANGHHALALVKEIERLGRVARNKPGTAKDGFDALGKRLAAAVPHFLPSYYEQVGRMFLAAENKNYAATMFTKARDAKRAHGLPVDEDVLAASFLEFALNGALPAKAVGEYARALSARTTAPEAFQRFRLLVIERSAGGLPPHSGLASDMKRLAKAAGLNAAEQEISLLRELLDQPALVRAAKPFWTSYAAGLVRLAKAEPAVRGKLLAMNPAFPGAVNGEADRFWLGLLADCGALEGLTAPAGQVPAEALPPDGAAGWLGRFVKNRSRKGGWYRTRIRMPELLELVTAMAPRLRAEGTPLAVVDQRVDADLVDLCLDLGLPVVREPGARLESRFDLGGWLDDGDHTGRRPLAAFAADEYFGRMLDHALEEFAGSSRRSARDTSRKTSPLADRFAELAPVPGLLTGVSRWLDRRAEKVAAGGLPALHTELGTIGRAVSARVAAVNPEPMRRVAALDIAPVLATALRSGILDEFCWPALEAACAKLYDADPAAVVPTASGTRAGIVEQWPYLLVMKDAAIAVVDGTGTVLEHTSSMPQSQQIWNHTLRFADGQLLVLWRGPGNSGAYWSGDPLRILDAQHFGYYSGSARSMEVPGHGRTFGGRPLRAGDTTVDEAGTVVSDGRTYWRQSPGHDDRWQEFDPATGAAGRASLPSFFEDGLPAGRTLMRQLCWVRPVVPGTEASPLGTARGLLGWRVHRGPDGMIVGDGVDGRTVRMAGTGEAYRDDVPLGRITFPGSAAPTTLTVGNGGWGHRDQLILGTPATAQIPIGERAPKYAKGTWCVPPLDYWNYLVPRDEAGSRFLRTVDAARARALMEAARRGLKGTPESDDDADHDAHAASGLAAVVQAVRAELPEVTHPNLITGIAGYVREAVEREADIAKIAEVLDAGADADAEAEAVDPRLTRPPWDDDLISATTGLVDVGRSYYYETAPPAGVSLSWLVSAFHGRDISKRWSDGDKVLQAVALLAALPALAYRAASPMAAEPVRATLSQLVTALAASEIAEADSAIRGVRTVRLDAAEVKRTDQTGAVLRTPNGCIVMCWIDTDWQKNNRPVMFWRGVQLTGADTFDDTVQGWALTADRPITRWPKDQLDRLVRRLAAGPFAWDPSAADRFAAVSGLTGPEALVALAGMPGVGYYGNGTVPADTRKRLGLTPAQAKAGLNRFDRIDRQERVALLAALAGADVAGLWDTGPDAEAAGAWWVDRYGKHATVSEDLLTEAFAALKKQPGTTRVASSDILQGLADLGAWKLVRTPVTAEGGITGDMVQDIARALLWLAYRLPYGDPFRAVLPEAAGLLRDRLRDPAMRIPTGLVGGTAQLENALGVRARPVDEHG